MSTNKEVGQSSYNKNPQIVIHDPVRGFNLYESEEGYVVSIDEKTNFTPQELFARKMIIPMFLIGLLCPNISLLAQAINSDTPSFNFTYSRSYILVVALLYLIVVIRIIKNRVARRKVGTASLIFDRWPLTLGGESEVIFRRNVHGDTKITQFEGALVCQEWIGGTSIHDRVTSKVLSSDSLPSPSLTHNSELIEARWMIHIPSKLPPTITTPYNQIRWSLNISFDTPHTVQETIQFPILVRPMMLS